MDADFSLEIAQEEHCARWCLSMDPNLDNDSTSLAFNSFSFEVCVRAELFREPGVALFTSAKLNHWQRWVVRKAMQGSRNGQGIVWPDVVVRVVCLSTEECMSQKLVKNIHNRMRRGLKESSVMKGRSRLGSRSAITPLWVSPKPAPGLPPL